MKKNLFRSFAACLLAGAAWQGYAAVADHLVVSEVGMNGSPNDVGEYIELFNPTSGPIDLSNYWVSDYRHYPNIANPALHDPLNPGKLDTGATDNIIRFPSGTILQSGQVLVICGKAGPSTGGVDLNSGFLWGAASVNTFGGGLANYQAQAGSPLLFEIDGQQSPGHPDDNPEVPNMISYSSHDVGEHTCNLTNASGTNGEFVALFYWDGTADLIKDVDIVVHGGSSAGSGNSPIIKTSSAPLGNNGATYENDGGSVTNLTVGDWDNTHRISLEEQGEPNSGGNGLTEHDETMEASSLSWQGYNGWTNPAPPAVGVTPGASPGTTTLTVFSGNLPPSVDAVDRNIQYPTPSDAITLSATVSDTDGTITNVEFYVDSGSGFGSAIAGTNQGSGVWTANIGTFLTGTLIKYYVVATDDDAATATFPPAAPAVYRSIYVAAVTPKPGDLIINEVVYDSVSTDAPDDTNPSTAHEFVELHNKLNVPMDVSYVQFADANLNWFTIPAGTSIPAKGYLILAIRSSRDTEPVGFIARYGANPNGAQVFAWGTFALNNGDNETLYLRHGINDVDFGGTGTYLDILDYMANEPWPTLSSNANGQSLELVNPYLDGDNPLSWKGDVVSTPPRATPGAQNSVYSSVIISDIVVNPAFPNANQSFTISAKIETVSPSITISTAQVFYDATGSFVSVNMTPTATPGVYSATIPGQPASTLVKYYLSVITNEPFTELQPKLAPAEYLAVLIGAPPIANGDVIFNEILYDNFDSDTYEFIELFNRTGSVVDLSHYVITDLQNGRFTFPQGAVIQAGGYAIVSMNDWLLGGLYPIPPGTPRYTWPENSIVLNNGQFGDVISLFHPNQYSPDGTGTPIDSINYHIVAPWPTWEGAIKENENDPEPNTRPDSPNRTGRSIELTQPNHPNRSTDGSLWAWTTTVVIDQEDSQVRGTPGLENSTLSAVGDWTLY